MKDPGKGLFVSTRPRKGARFGGSLGSTHRFYEGGQWGAHELPRWVPYS